MPVALPVLVVWEGIVAAVVVCFDTVAVGFLLVGLLGSADLVAAVFEWAEHFG